MSLLNFIFLNQIAGTSKNCYRTNVVTFKFIQINSYVRNRSPTEMETKIKVQTGETNKHKNESYKIHKIMKINDWGDEGKQEEKKKQRKKGKER